MRRILFTTVYKPFGLDSSVGRKENFVESYHTRLTRAQGIFSYRGHFSSFGLHLIAANLSTPSTVLEYPSWKRFLRELKKGYDYVGIGSVVANLQKVKIMAEAVRQYSPKSKIVVGGHCAHIETIRELMPMDYLCTGEGVSFMRELLHEPASDITSNLDVFSRGRSFLGVPLWRHYNPHVIVGLGCPYGCEYCSPSHHFGSKYIRFYERGEQLYAEMERLERRFGTRSMGFLGDDNFLNDQRRAEELRHCIVKSGKQYELFYFASADRIMQFGPQNMAEMGTNVVWIGRETCLIDQQKTRHVNLHALVDELHQHGIKVILSSMLFMEHHHPDNLWKDVEDHLAIAPDFSMFGLCSPFPGTPFYDRLKAQGRIFIDRPYEDWHGLGELWFEHPYFSMEQSRRIRDEIVLQEFRHLGPSAMRLILTDLQGYLFMRDSSHATLRQRAAAIASKARRYRAILWAMSRLAPDKRMGEMIAEGLAKFEAALGRTSSWEKMLGAGLWSFGAKEKLRQRIWGDVLQPPTRVTRYPQACGQE